MRIRERPMEGACVRCLLDVARDRPGALPYWIQEALAAGSIRPYLRGCSYEGFFVDTRESERFAGPHSWIIRRHSGDFDVMGDAEIWRRQFVYQGGHLRHPQGRCF